MNEVLCQQVCGRNEDFREGRDYVKGASLMRTTSIGFFACQPTRDQDSRLVQDVSFLKVLGVGYECNKAVNVMVSLRIICIRVSL